MSGNQAKDPLAAKLMQGSLGPAQAGVCIVLIKNGTPCNWNVTIVGAACEFYYRSGRKCEDRDERLSLSCNESTDLRSDDPDECVGRVKVAIVTSHPRDGRAVFIGERTAPEGRCILRTTYTLAPKSTRESSEKPATSADLVEIV